jgi:hypothetical protein
VFGRTFRVNRGSALFGSATPRPGIHRSGITPFCASIVAMAASVLLPTSTEAGSDYRIPRLRGIKAITTSVNIVVDGSAKPGTSPCHLDRIAIEHHTAETLHNAGLDAIGAADSLAKPRAHQSGFDNALDDLEATPPNAKPNWDREQAERRRREGDVLAFQPFQFVQVAVATLENGLCAAGITTELRAFTPEKPVINYDGDQVQIALAVWGAPPLALAVPAAELEHAVTERGDLEDKEFIAAWRAANGQ